MPPSLHHLVSQGWGEGMGIIACAMWKRGAGWLKAYIQPQEKELPYRSWPQHSPPFQRASKNCLHFLNIYYPPEIVEESFLVVYNLLQLIEHSKSYETDYTPKLAGVDLIPQGRSLSEDSHIPLCCSYH